MLSFEQKKEIKDYALKSMPNECCGIILKNNEVVFCKNESSNPQKHFSINSEVLLKNLNKGIKLIFHSHPNGSDEFSMMDKFYQNQYSLPLIVYSVQKDSFNILIDNFIFNNNENANLNCINFVKNYFEEKLKRSFDKLFSEKSKTIASLNPVDFYSKSFNEIDVEETMKEINFLKIGKENFKKEDVVMFKKFNILHFGIFFDNFILHKGKRGVTFTDMSLVDKKNILAGYRYAE